MYRIGIDLGGTNIAAGIVNDKFEIVAQDSTPTLVGRPGVEIVDDIAMLCKKLCESGQLADGIDKGRDIEAEGDEIYNVHLPLHNEKTAHGDDCC